MAITTYKSTVTSTDTPDIYQAQVRDFTINYDLTGRDNGYEEGMQPAEAILAALGACESIVAGSFKRKQHFDYTSFYIALEGQKNTDSTRPGLDAIHMTVHFRTPNSKAEAKKFVEFMENTCPVRDNLANTVPIVFKDVQAE
jgi:uncharacterized OsmC-like protein